MATSDRAPRPIDVMTAESGSNARRVLVVEDSATQARHLQLILQSAGFTAEIAGDGQQALTLLDRGPVDLVMSDIVMPGMSGYELCQAIKSRPDTRAVPVVLLTSLNDADDIIKGLAAGADNFISKPYDPSYLIDRVQHVLRGHGEWRAGGDDAPSQFRFMNRTVTVSSPRQQIMSFLLSTFEDYARAKQREKEALRLDVENKQKAAGALARKTKELEESNSRLEGLNAQLGQLNAELGTKNEQLAVAKLRLENSYDDLKKEQALRDIETRRMEVELQTARSVQRMLIPKGPPRDIPGFEFAFSYLSATETGGDWIGFIEDPPSKQLMVMIGDVTGHGASAALITAGVFSFFSAMKVQGQGIPRSLVDLLHQLNRVIIDMACHERSMTFFVSVIDWERRTIRYAGAGHPHPFVLRRSSFAAGGNKAVRSLLARGSPLGMPTSPHFEEHTEAIEPGDLIVWFTDGVIENRSVDEVGVGEKGLRGWLRDLYGQPAAAVCAAIDQRLHDFLAPKPPADDMALIVAQAL